MNEITLYALATIAALGAGLASWVAYKQSNAGTYGDMEKTLTNLSRRLAELEDEREEDYRAIVAMRYEIDQWKRGVIELSAQLTAAGIDPVWTPEKAGIAVAITTVDLPRLKRQLQAHFSISELDDLALALSINREDLEGDTIGRRSQSLIRYAERHDVIGELVAQARVMRPRAHW